MVFEVKSMFNTLNSNFGLDNEILKFKTKYLLLSF